MDCDHVEDGKQNRMPNAAEVTKTTPENVTSEVVFSDAAKGNAKMIACNFQTTCPF